MRDLESVQEREGGGLAIDQTLNALSRLKIRDYLCTRVANFSHDLTDSHAHILMLQFSPPHEYDAPLGPPRPQDVQVCPAPPLCLLPAQPLRLPHAHEQLPQSQRDLRLLKQSSQPRRQPLSVELRIRQNLWPEVQQFGDRG